MRKRRTEYDLTASIEHCREHGLTFDVSSYERFARVRLMNINLSQRQFNAVMFSHISVIHHTFNPERYTFRQRVQIAAHFLFGKELKPNKS